MKQAEESTDIRLIIKCLFVRTLQEVNYLQLWCTRLGNLRFGLLHSDRKFDSNPCHSLCHKSSTCWRSIPFSCCHRYLLFPSVSSNVHEFSCHNTLAKILYRQDLKNKIHPSHKQYVSLISWKYYWLQKSLFQVQTFARWIAFINNALRGEPKPMASLFNLWQGHIWNVCAVNTRIWITKPSLATCCWVATFCVYIPYVIITWENLF